MKWKLKTSNAKNSQRVCVIKVTKNNLTGDFMSLNNLGNAEYSYSPESIGTYRVVNNADRAKRAIKGCCLVYQLDGEAFYRCLRVSDQKVRNIPENFLQDADYINNLVRKIRTSV